MTMSVFSSDTITIKTPIRLLELFCTTYHEVPNNRWGRGFHAIYKEFGLFLTVKLTKS